MCDAAKPWGPAALWSLRWLTTSWTSSLVILSNCWCSSPSGGTSGRFIGSGCGYFRSNCSSYCLSLMGEYGLL